MALSPEEQRQLDRLEAELVGSDRQLDDALRRAAQLRARGSWTIAGFVLGMVLQVAGLAVGAVTSAAGPVLIVAGFVLMVTTAALGWAAGTSKPVRGHAR